MSYRPGRGFRVGAMRDRITVSTETTEQDDAGQPVVSLTDWLTNEPADFYHASGGETFRGRQLEAGIKAVFTVRYRSGYAANQLVTRSGVRYGVVHALPVDGKNRYTELHCKAVV